MNGYAKQVAADAAGEKPLYRSRQWNRDEREKMKMEKEQNWFSNDGKFEHIMMIPATPSGILKKNDRTGK